MSNVPASGEATRLAVLGALSYAPMHGYEIRREIERRRLERWADISYGSIYGRLRRLVDEAMVEVVRTERVSNRPARTVYGITGAGEDELARLMQIALSHVELPTDTIDLALSYCITPAARFGAARLARLMEERLAHLDGVAGELREALGSPVSDQAGVAALVEDLIGHSQLRVAVEREWTEHVLKRLAAGSYHAPPVGPMDRTDHQTPTGDASTP